eukprot:1012376-Lingulodinium_polyedra.AAC.1
MPAGAPSTKRTSTGAATAAPGEKPPAWRAVASGCATYPFVALAATRIRRCAAAPPLTRPSTPPLSVE